MALSAFPTEAIGKRLKSESDVTMFERFPDSPTVRTLPAGKPSPIITGYIPKGFWQLEGSEDTALYVKDTPGVNVVSPEAPDQSGLIDSGISWLSDFISNTAGQVKKQSGFLAEGFTKSVSGVGAGLFNIAGAVKPILIIIAVILGLWAIIKFQE